MNISRASFRKMLHSSRKRVILYPDRAWLFLLAAFLVVSGVVAGQGMSAYLRIEGNEVVGGEDAPRILTRKEFAPVFSAYREKEKQFGTLLELSPNISDPAK